MGDRRFAERIFFQGKPAFQPLSRRARWPRSPVARSWCCPIRGAMGALGIALLASQASGADRAAGAGPDGDGAVERRARGAWRGRRRPGPGRPRRLCGRPAWSSARAAAAATRTAPTSAGSRRPSSKWPASVRRVVSGGNCPKYDDRSEAGAKLPQDAPNPYRERDELLACSRWLESAGRGCGRPCGRPPPRPAASPLPGRHAAVLRRLPGGAGSRGRGVAPDRRDAGPGRSALRGARRLRAGQDRPRPDRGGRRGAARRPLRAGVHQPAVARCGRHLHLPDRPGHAADARARPGRRDRAAAGGAAGVLRRPGRTASADADRSGELEAAASACSACTTSAAVRAAQVARLRLCGSATKRGLREIGDSRARLRARAGVPVVLIVGEVDVGPRPL